MKNELIALLIEAAKEVTRYSVDVRNNKEIAEAMKRKQVLIAAIYAVEGGGR